MKLSELTDWFALRNVEPELVLAQYAELHRQVPLLYALLAVNSLAVTYTHFGFAPSWMTVLVPAVLVLASLARLVVWLARRHRQSNAQDALRELRKTYLLAVILASAYVAWALKLNAYGGHYEQAHVAIFIAITVIGCILCLTKLPQAALSVTLIVTIPYLAYYLSTGNTVFKAVGLNMFLVTAVMIQVMLNHFHGFRQLVTSKGVTERLSRENLRMAHTDALTGLPNRRYFFEALNDRFAQAAENGKPLAVGVIDLDRFKPVNDTFGHLVGDRLLEAVAERLRETSVPTLLISRLGGDEFAFILDCDEVSATDYAGKICAELAEPFKVENLTLSISGSCGVAMLESGCVEAHQLFDRADYVLYTSKESNQGNVTVYSPAHESKILSAQALESAMRSADLEAEMHIVLQPLVNYRRGEVVAVEALARWKSPSLGDVPPTSFIAAAERSGMMHDLTLMLLTKTLDLVERLPPGMKLSFNLSAHDITSPSTIFAMVASILRSGVDASRLVFEVTETAVIRDFNTAIGSLDMLRALGAHIALDDFGTGYSSLSYLLRLPIDRVKIDRSFIPGCDTEAGCNLLSSILALCSSLKLTCIAEGVEDADQVSILRNLGYESFQGYYFAKPMPIEELAPWAQAWTAEQAAGRKRTIDRSLAP
ncbi:EAL domain-containing protein [Jiella sp. KSK16Y-1]|uniref:EAL domain-containing protein n=2 Tax=Jiella mangrovi TaxID=2821407 RepID=A0ABS4BB40_9HYPH|nr:EAL domain-containing protein [Jiella mangrovi]